MKSNTTVARRGHRAMFCPSSQQFGTPGAIVRRFPMAVGIPPAVVGRFPMLVGIPPAVVSHFPMLVGIPLAVVGRFPMLVGIPPAMVSHFPMLGAIHVACCGIRCYPCIRPPNFAHDVLAAYGKLLPINTPKMIV